jgi:hypothetical protein
MSTIGNTAAGPSYTSGGAEQASSGTTEQAKEKVQETAQQAAGQARGQIRRQVDERSTQAGEQVASAASDARGVAQHLREQGKEQPAKLAEQAADRAERLGSYLKEADGEAILRDVEDFGRRKPWAVMAGGLAAGFLASRFLKASSTRRSQAGSGSPVQPESTNGTTAPRAATPTVSAPPATPPTTPPATPRAPETAPPRPAENVSLTAGVLPTSAPERPGPGNAA